MKVFSMVNEMTVYGQFRLTMREPDVYEHKSRAKRGDMRMHIEDCGSAKHGAIRTFFIRRI